MISHDHPDGYKHLKVAQSRNLRVACLLDGRLKVSSASKPWLPVEQWYDVFVTDGFYSCACQEPYPKAKA